MSEDAIYLTVGSDQNGRGLVAIATRGHPQRGDEKCEVLTLELVKNMKAAKAWFNRVKIEQPWVVRN